MIYVDVPRRFPHKRKQYAHMMGDTLEELHSFAGSLGIKRHWFHRDHYDISNEQWHEAVISGAKVVDSRRLVQVRKSLEKK